MKFYAMSQEIKKLMMFYQRTGMGNEEYKRQFDALWDTVEQFGGSVANHPDLIAASAIEIAADNGRFNANRVGSPIDADAAAAADEVRDQMKACFMLGGANNN